MENNAIPAGDLFAADEGVYVVSHAEQQLQDQKPESPSSIDRNGTTPSNPPAKKTNGKAKKPLAEVQLIGDLPLANDEARKSFEEIEANRYQYQTLGRSREALESMTCDCTYVHGSDDPDFACGPDSDCINRLTQVECLPDDCKCRQHCMNQRFQKRQYATIDIVQTEKKGFGLRASREIRKDSFIYEYVGDVVNQPSFKKRMRDYAEEGIRHFYFMMLQRDEFIDATKRGGIGRFANHSCNPNCYVAKWTIGSHVRMGIFASRNIKCNEELTFNYNVDRYGHDAQPCYCGEAKCVGYIGGKTQTDLVTMDDLYLDALGITDEDARAELKGTKKKKGKKIDDPDFQPTMFPILEKEVPKVVQAMRQTQSRKVLSKLLTRMKITTEQSALRQIMRLRGFSLMTNVLEDYASDMELINLALECMLQWPLLARNKVDDSKVEVPVKRFVESADESVKTVAQKLLDHWSTLESSYRIPRRANTGDDLPTGRRFNAFSFGTEVDEAMLKRSRYADDPEITFKPSPIVTVQRADTDTDGSRTPKGPRALLGVSDVKAKSDEPETPAVAVVDYAFRDRERKAGVNAIIAAAKKKAEEEELAKAMMPVVTDQSGENGKKKKRSRDKDKERSQKRQKQTPEEKEANKEKRLIKLVGQVVVKCLSKHSKTIDHDSFKKHAKELTQIIADKEKKSASYKENRLDSLSEEKVVKIKKFAKEYIAKILRKLDKEKKQRASTSTSASNGTPQEENIQGTPEGEGEGDVGMSVEDALGIEGGDDSGSDGDGDGDGEVGKQDSMDVSPNSEGSHQALERTHSADPRRRLNLDPNNMDEDMG